MSRKRKSNVEKTKKKHGDFTCPVCGGVFHEKTSLYDDEKPLHGAMFRLKQEFIDNVWDHFDEVESTIGDNLVCPGCGNCYADSMTGKVRPHGG